MGRRYYFDMQEGDVIARDEEGIELPDVETAMEEAARALADMARDAVRGHAYADHKIAIKVRDDGGHVLQAKFAFEVDTHQGQCQSAVSVMNGNAIACIAQDQADQTVQERALSILREFEQARAELNGKPVVLSDGKAGTVEKLKLDELHGLRVALSGHDGDWPISTLRFPDEV